MPTHDRHPADGPWRDEAAAAALIACLPSLALRGRVLLVDDDLGLVAAALAGTGIETWVWRRRAARGRTASAWVEGGPYDAALVRLPMGRETLEMLLHAAASRLRPGSPLVVAGANDEGIRSAAPRLAALLGDVATLDARRHCRVLLARRPADIPGLRGEPTAWRRRLALETPAGRLDIVSYPGLFAHGRLDAGTALLLAALPRLAPGARALDFGCGAGVVGAALRHLAPEARIDLLDVAALAVEAARENVPGARAILGDGWGAVGPSRYDLIVANPPIHNGKAEDLRVLRDLVERAPEHLRDGGTLRLVALRTLPVERLLARTFGRVERLGGSTRFTVWGAGGPPPAGERPAGR